MACEGEVRIVTEADVRLDADGRIIAAPMWAYEYGFYPYGEYRRHGERVFTCYEPIEAAWGPVREGLLRLLAARRARRWEAEVARVAELLVNREHFASVSADATQPESARDFARLWLRSARVPPMPREGDEPPPSLSIDHRFGDERKTCRECGEDFFALGSTRLCTPACVAARRKATRTRGEPRSRLVDHESRRCDHCREAFTPRRKDARFCSVRCRVAHHRAADTTVTT